MKRLLIAFAFVVAFAGSSSAQTTTTLSGITCPGTGCATLATAALGTGVEGIQITGTFVGTIVFEQTVNGTIWLPFYVTSTTVSAPVSQTTAAGIWSGSPEGAASTRVRFSVYVSGSAILTTSYTQAGSGGGGDTTATYVLNVAKITLPNAQALGDLATGIVKNTTSTGALSIAAAGTDYLAPTGSGAGLSGVGLTASGLSQFAATTSAELRGVLSDESGTGVAVFNNTPTLTSPVIAKIGGITTNGFLKTSAGDGTLSVDSAAYVSTADTYSNPAFVASLAWAKLSGVPTTISGYGIVDGVATGSSYANPAWIASLAWSKLSSTPTTLSGYGITDASPIAGSSSIVTTGTVTSGTWSGAFGIVSGANLTNLTAANISAGTAGINISGNAATATSATTATSAGTVTNGVVTTGSYADPAWLTSIAANKIAAGTAGIDISGNAATATNGVVTTGSYANPAWITSLAASKLTGSYGATAFADTTAAGSGSLAGALLDLTQTWNTTGTPTAISLNVTNTASTGTTYLMQLKVGGTARFKFGSDSNNSFYIGSNWILDTGSGLRFLTGGAQILQVNDTGLIAGNGNFSAAAFNFGNSNSPSTVTMQVVGSTSQTAHVFDVNASNNAGGDLFYVTKDGVTKNKILTVSTLPTCSGTGGMWSSVSDSNSTTNGGTVAGGGSSVVPVFCNGANWIIK